MRWRIRITDTTTSTDVLDIQTGRIHAAAVATAVGLPDAAKKIIGDPRSDDVQPPSPSSTQRNLTPDR